MGNLLIKDKQVVVPGEELANGMDYLPGSGTYRDNDTIISTRLGLVNVDGRAIKIIPLSGEYLPKKNDTIIGKVIDVTLNGWRLETNSAYSALLSMKDGTSEFIQRGADLTQYHTFGDYLVVNIFNVTSQKLVDVTMRGPGLRKLGPGRVIKVNPTKVPRIIGNQGSMISMIKQHTDCQITVGQNGLIWLSGSPKNEVIVVETIRKIENESHVSGLTERIQKFLEKNSKGVQK
jgi:exosome complex component RRP4